MFELEPTLEVDRIRNLIINFGWKIAKQKIEDDEITLTIVKERPAKAPELDVGAS